MAQDFQRQISEARQYIDNINHELQRQIDGIINQDLNARLNSVNQELQRRVDRADQGLEMRPTHAELGLGTGALQVKIDALSLNALNIDRRLDTISLGLNARIDRLEAICRELDRENKVLERRLNRLLKRTEDFYVCCAIL